MTLAVKVALNPNTTNQPTILTRVVKHWIWTGKDILSWFHFCDPYYYCLHEQACDSGGWNKSTLDDRFDRHTSRINGYFYRQRTSFCAKQYFFFQNNMWTNLVTSNFFYCLCVHFFFVSLLQILLYWSLINPPPPAEDLVFPKGNWTTLGAPNQSNYYFHWAH